MSILNYTAATLAILSTLGKDPDGSLHTRKIAEEAHVSVGAASMILRVLEDQHMVTCDVKGNMKLYKLDLFNPVAREFKVLFNVRDLNPLVDSLRDYTDKIVLFGSCAEGIDGRDSDVDVFILTQHPQQVRERIAMFRKQFPRPLSLIIASPEEQARLRRQDAPLFASIVKGKMLWQRQ